MLCYIVGDESLVLVLSLSDCFASTWWTLSRSLSTTAYKLKHTSTKQTRDSDEARSFQGLPTKEKRLRNEVCLYLWKANSVICFSFSRTGTESVSGCVVPHTFYTDFSPFRLCKHYIDGNFSQFPIFCQRQATTQGNACSRCLTVPAQTAILKIAPKLRTATCQSRSRLGGRLKSEPSVEATEVATFHLFTSLNSCTCAGCKTIGATNARKRSSDGMCTPSLPYQVPRWKKKIK